MQNMTKAVHNTNTITLMTFMTFKAMNDYIPDLFPPLNKY